jgi:hypothetical protein
VGAQGENFPRHPEFFKGKSQVMVMYEHLPIYKKSMT